MEGELEDIVADNVYYDPDEDQETDNLEAEEETTSDNDDEPSLEDETSETDQDDDEENPDEEPDVDPMIDLGEEQVALSELKAERMLHQDYSRKTAEVAREKETVQQSRDHYSQQTQLVESLLHETVEYIQSLIPDAPPHSLMNSNPQEYLQRKELRDQALQEVQALVDRSKQVKDSKETSQGFDNNQLVRQHVAGLEHEFPHLKGDQKKLVAFVQEQHKAAQDFGFTEQETALVTDNRLLTMAYYAAKGKKAEHNRNNAKRRIQTPKKSTPRPATAQTGTGNKKAMQRLEQTGSLKDALNVDFD